MATFHSEAHQRAIELIPDYAWAIVSRGQSYRVLGRYGEALADVSQAIELDENHNWCLYERFLVLIYQGNLRKPLVISRRRCALRPRGWRRTRPEIVRLIELLDGAVAALGVTDDG